jgi:hypothetical protein
MNVGIMSCFEKESYKDYDKFAFMDGQTLLEYDIVIWDMAYLHFGYHPSTRINDFKRLLKDRRRRLSEIEELLEKGKSLVILCPPPDAINHGNLLDPSFNNDYLQILQSEGIGEKPFDIYSFLLPEIETAFRESAVKGEDCQIDFRGDQALLDGWLCIKQKAWYSVYLLTQIGTPFLFVKNTNYPTGSWFRHKNGYIFLIPATQYDDGEDYPLFVEAAKSLVEGVTNPIGKQVEVSWEDDDYESHKNDDLYVNFTRIRALRKISHSQFDVSKLIRLCEEINIAFQNKAYFSTMMLIRAILDHIPPIFGFSTFSEVANQYPGGRSFKEIMVRLDKTSRKIADMHLHQHVHDKEVLPNKVQVNFSNELDILLGEIDKLLSKE